jgi:hypothetical protein
MMRRSALSSVLALVLIACKNDAPPPDAPLQPVTPEVASSPSPPPSIPLSPPPTASTHAPAPPVVDTPPLACKTDDDCWFDDDRKPAPRPAWLRGRKIAPCKGSEHVPACKDNVCIVRAYKC